MKKLHRIYAPLVVAAIVLAPIAHATEPAAYNQPVNLQTLFAAPGEAATTDRIEQQQALNVYKNLDLDNFKLSGFMASRRPESAPEPATDYRTYLGVGYQDTIAETVQLSGRTFYGAGTYDGDNSYVNPTGGALPDEVRADGKAVGEWLGTAWKVNTRLFDRQTLEAGVDYRQPVATHLFDDRRLFGGLASADDAPGAHRSVGLSAGSTVAVAGDLSVNAHVRMDADASGYDVGVTHAPAGGIRTGLSYAIQQLADPLAASNAATVQRTLTKADVSVPFLSERFSTTFEVQRNAIESPLLTDGRRDFVVGNLTLASGQMVRNTSISVGVQNLFDTRGINADGAAIAFMPADGRSLHLDLKRTF